MKKIFLLGVVCFAALAVKITPVFASDETPALASGKNPALLEMETGQARPAPVELTLAGYEAWAARALPEGAISAFTPNIFAWFDREAGLSDLPEEVGRSADKILVNVAGPLAETIALEDAGEIETGTTVGAEVYAEMEGSVDQALEAMLFQWGKPVGKMEGRTYFTATPFARRVEYFSPLAEMGAGAYANLTLRRDGGIVKDLADRYVLLVRGDSARGYTVVMQFVKPALKTQTQRVFAIALLRPLGEGKVSYRISTRYQGQSYKVLGNVSIGRAQIGFNAEKVKAVALDYRSRLDELRKTGTITERRTDIEWGK